jgi:hypothetical protein
MLLPALLHTRWDGGIMGGMDEQTEQQAPRTKVLKNGAVYDLDKGRIVAIDNSRNPHAITPQKSSEFKQARREKAARLLRARIVDAHNGKMVPVGSSPAAFADAGALLWEEVVLNKTAYPRDRLETWEKLGRHAEVLADPREPAQQTPMQQASELTGKMAEVLTALTAFLQTRDTIESKLHDTIEGTAEDVE